MVPGAHFKHFGPECEDFLHHSRVPGKGWKSISPCFDFSFSINTAMALNIKHLPYPQGNESLRSTCKARAQGDKQKGSAELGWWTPVRGRRAPERALLQVCLGKGAFRCSWALAGCPGSGTAALVEAFMARSCQSPKDTEMGSTCLPREGSGDRDSMV